VDKLRPCLVVLLVLLTGCIPFQSNGTKHVLVIGVGLVSVPLTNSPNTQVSKSQAIGLIVSDQPGIKAGLGYSSSTIVQIATNQNILVEVSAKPGQPIKVKTQ
jgi:hypothetical protein